MLLVLHTHNRVRAHVVSSKHRPGDIHTFVSRHIPSAVRLTASSGAAKGAQGPYLDDVVHAEHHGNHARHTPAARATNTSKTQSAAMLVMLLPPMMMVVMMTTMMMTTTMMMMTLMMTTFPSPGESVAESGLGGVVVRELQVDVQRRVVVHPIPRLHTHTLTLGGLLTNIKWGEGKDKKGYTWNSQGEGVSF
jgi:hypothetical protein